MSSRSGVRAFGSALLVLGIIAGVGAWNYQRNLAVERAARTATPFRGYSDDDLASLRAAYEAESDALRREYEARGSRRAQVRKTRGVQEGIAEFERLQRSSERVRDIGQELAASEQRAAEIAREQARRAKVGSEFAVHFRRLTGIALPL